MSKLRSTLLATLAGAVILAGCSSKEAENRAETTQVVPSDGATGVTRQEIEPPATPAPAPVAPVLQTQPGPKGSQVTLNRVAVTGDVLTVSMTFTGGTCCSYIKINEISAIDDATSQRLGVLKDNAGNPMAAPLYNDDGKELRVDATKPAVVWAKFPAPPATSKTVSIAVPEVGPFDAVPITR